MYVSQAYYFVQSEPHSTMGHCKSVCMQQPVRLNIMAQDPRLKTSPE